MLKLALCSLLVGSPALAQQCAGFADVTATFAEKYGEAVTVRGLERTGNALVVLTNPDTGTWTLFVVMPDGTACQISDGVALSITSRSPTHENPKTA